MTSCRLLSPFHPFHDYPRRHSCDCIDDILEESAAMRSWESGFDIGTADITRSAVPRSYEMSLASRKSVASLKTYGRFRPREANRRSTSTETVHTEYVQDEFGPTHTGTDIFKSNATSNIYHDHQKCSGHCEFDLDAGPIRMQLNGRECGLLEGLSISRESIEVPWLPMQSTPRSLPPRE